MGEDEGWSGDVGEIAANGGYGLGFVSGGGGECGGETGEK